jgi:hypothetical protein
MTSLKMWLIAIIMMTYSFSIIKSEYTSAEKILIKNLAEKTLNNAIDCCDITEEDQFLYDNNNDYSKSTNLFLNSIDQMPIVEIVSLINEHIDKATKKAELAPCANCKYFAEELQLIKNNCNQGITEGSGSCCYFQLPTPENEQQFYNKTISQILETEEPYHFALYHFKKLEKEGKGELTLFQIHQQKQEKLLREELNLMQNNK